VYVTVQGTKVYVCALKTDNTCMYVTVKGKPMYAKEDTDWARVRPRNSDTKKNRGCQATCDTKTQENREQ
jgi:hypothetical protein